MAKIVEPLVFSQTWAVAVLVGLVAWAAGRPGPFAAWMFGLGVLHLVLQLSVLYRMYGLNSPRTAWAAVWYPVAGLVSDVISINAIIMCLTGRVTWRGTTYGPAAPTPHPTPAPAQAHAPRG